MTEQFATPPADDTSSVSSRNVDGGRGPTPHRERRPGVLVVEDDDDTRLLLQTLLAPHYEVVLYAEAADAIEHVQRRAGDDPLFEAALLDISLGGLQTGVDVLEALRAREEYEAMPVVAMTAYVLPGDRERFLSYGFDAYLSKPFVPEVLEELIDRLLRQ